MAIGMLRPGARLAALALIAAGVGMAQKVISAKAGLVYFVEGHAAVAGSGPLAAGEVNRQLNPGEILFSENGRAEVLLNPGTVLRIGDRTAIRMDRVELTDARVSVEAGSAVVTVYQAPKLDRVEIGIGGAVVKMEGAGVYRFDSDGSDRGALRVFSGQAFVYRENGVYREGGASQAVAKRGQAVRLQDLQVGKFDVKAADALQQWAETRGAPPPWTPLPPMQRLSPPAKTPEFEAWLKECGQR